MSTISTPLEILEEKLPGGGSSFTIVKVEGGSFLIDGKIETEISSFWIGQHQVSQELWEEVMDNNPSRFKSPTAPVERGSWYEAIEFCNYLSKKQGHDPVYIVDKTQKDPNNHAEYDKLKWRIEKDERANGYRLPTEAEWEYAARGGKYSLGTSYSGSKALNKVGWYGWIGNIGRNETQELGLKAPNELGLYDMSGNVWEWCEDWYEDYPDGPLKDPKGPKSGQHRELRGGSWSISEGLCRVAFRSLYLPDGRSNDICFRLSRTAL